MNNRLDYIVYSSENKSYETQSRHREMMMNVILLKTSTEEVP